MDCSDETIFARIQQGDQDAFEALMQRYQDRLYTIALKILQQPHDAQDAVQQAFLQIWQKRKTFNPKRRLSSWLYRVLTNICIDEYRRRQRRKPASETALENLIAPGSPVKDLEQTERRRALHSALARVPLEERIALVLCYMEGLSYAEVAKARGISVHTVKGRLRRAKTLLREHLQGLMR